MSRATVAIVLSALFMVALFCVQRFVTSPGVTTDAEWHVMLLASVPAMTVVLSAYWVADGRRDRR